MSKSINRKAQSFCSWIVVLMAFGYPLQVSIPLIFHMDTGIWNIFFRALYAISCIILFLYKYPLRNRFKISESIALSSLIIFWIIYMARLIYDLSIRNIAFGARSNFWVYSMALGNALIPIITISLYLSQFKMDFILKRSYLIIWISCLLILYLVFYQNETIISTELLGSRVNITGEQDDMLVINTIIIGIYGNLLASSSLASLLFQKAMFKYNILYFIGLLVGAFIIIMAASRGPLLSFSIIMIILLFFYIYHNRFKFRFYIKSVIFVFALLLFLGSIKINISDLAIFNRVQNFLTERQTSEKEGRDFEWSSAWTQFQDYPLLGDRYLNIHDDYYPHNIILEVLMATGVIGFIPFTIFFLLLIKSIFKSFANIYKDIIVINVLVLSLLLSTFTSGGLFTITYFWALAPLVFKRNTADIEKNVELNILYPTK